MSTCETQNAVVEETVGTDQLACVMSGRAATYALLSRLFCVEADAGLLDELQAGRYPVTSGNEAMDAGYHLLARAATNLWENSVEELAVDFARCFIGHGSDGYSAAYPYESVHVGERRLMMQDARDEVRAIYLSEGLDKAAAWKENEDHVASELEFMQVMCERCAEALREGDAERAAGLAATQRNFLEDHLAPWVPLFAKQVRFYAQSDLYAGAAWLLEGFMQVERDFLAELLEAGEE